ncbi:MAG: ACT domain-containing protein [Acidimicrobiales bacterium]
MATLVLTVIGDDQSGLVEQLSGVIADHGGNWDTSHMARLAGKFAGIVLISVSDNNVDALVTDLEPLETEGLLHITAEQVTSDEQPDSAPTLLTLELFGQDHPGIVHDISHALATKGVSIDELTTETKEAPMSGGILFKATAVLRAPADVSMAELSEILEDLANDLMVDVQLEGLN